MRHNKNRPSGKKSGLCRSCAAVAAPRPRTNLALRVHPRTQDDRFVSHCRECGREKHTKNPVKKREAGLCRGCSAKRATRPVQSNGSRRCARCQEWRHVEEFHKRSDRRDGLHSYCKACVNAWRVNHKDVLLAASHRRTARKLGNGGSFTAAEWRELREKYGNVCLNCGSKERLSPDHVIPVSKGGSSDIGNIQPLCFPCNNRKRARIVDYRPAYSETAVSPA